MAGITFQKNSVILLKLPRELFSTHVLFPARIFLAFAGLHLDDEGRTTKHARAAINMLALPCYKSETRLEKDQETTIRRQ